MSESPKVLAKVPTYLNDKKQALEKLKINFTVPESLV